MVDRLLTDMSKSLDNDCYFAALSLALILIDMCGKAEYQDSFRNKERYVKWFDEYIGQYEQPPNSTDEIMPCLSGEVVYQLRCCLLHQGTPNVDAANIKAAENKVDHFSLVIEKKNQFDTYSDCSTIATNDFCSTKVRSCRVNVRRLCLIISNTVRGYYEQNRGKFDFMKCDLVDSDAINDMLLVR